MRFLVAPMLWWSAAAAGLAFADAGVAGRDVTHPIPWQWALVAVAVAATLVAARLRPDATLTAPTRLAAWVGVPLAEIVVLAAATAAGGAAWPVLVAGLATAVGVWLLLPDRPVLVANLEGALVVLTAFACAPEFGTGWCAAVSSVALVALVEVTARRKVDTATAAGWLVVAGCAAFLSLAEPVAALVVALLGTAWALVRLLRPGPDLGLDRWPAVIGAVGFPLLAVAAVSRIWSLDAGLVGLGVAIVAVSATQRAREDLHQIGLTMWALAQSAVVIALVLGERSAVTGYDGAQIAALVAVAVGLALVPEWRCGRVWLVTVVASFAGLLTASSLGWSTATTAVVAAAVGLVAVVVGQPRATAVEGHVAVMGHVVGIAALAGAVGAQVDPTTRPAWPAVATTLTVGAVGWAVSAVVGELHQSGERDLWTRLILAMAGATSTVHADATAAGQRPYGSVLLTGAALTWWMFVPGALLVATDRVPIGDHWLPVSVLAVALVGVGLGRALFASRPLVGRTLSVGIWTGVVAVPAAASWWPAFAASLLVLAMAVLSGPVLGNLFTITLGWVASGIATVTLAGAVGVAPDHLHRAAFAWATVALLGSLVVDQVRNGARHTGQVVRSPALWPPFVLGAVTVPLALTPILAETAPEAGWSLLAGAAVAFATAALLHLALLSTIGWVAAASALLLFSPWDLLEAPWLLVPLAAALLVAAEVARDLTHPDDTTRFVQRWDLPPFAVAQVAAVGALGLSGIVGWIPATWWAVAALWALTGVRTRTASWLLPAVPVSLVAAAVAGPGWLTLALGITAVGCVVAATRTHGDIRTALQVVAALTVAGWWASTAWWLSWDPETIAIATALASGAALLALAVGIRWLHLGEDWYAAFAAVPVVGELTALALLATDVPRSPARLVVALGLTATATAAGLLARPLDERWLRWATAVIVPGAAVLAGSGLALGPTAAVLFALSGSLAAVLFGSLLLEVGTTDDGHVRPWPPPVLLTGGLLLATAFAVALAQLPDRPLLVGVLATTGVELLGMAVVTRRLGWLMAAPWAFLAAWVTFASEALTGDAQWFTLPIGLTILTMVEIIRWSRRRAGATDRVALLGVVDLAGMAFVVAPAIVETVTRTPAWGLVAVALGVGLALLGVVTRVRRRLIGGAVAAAVALVLMIVPPLVELVPPLTGWVPWALLAVVGLAALMAAAFLEKGRRLVRRGLRAFTELTDGWE